MDSQSPTTALKGGNASPKHEVSGIQLLASGPRVQAREFNVAPGQHVRWHTHTHLTDWCFCLEGEVSFEVADVGRKTTSVQILREGEHCVIPMGVVHRLRNAGAIPCRYLLVQSGAHYDFLEASGDWLPSA
ncbi:cupin domain-containing protein [Variovorax sp. LT1R16]|uniref:cupin domain-containing protein n=1 Tax=Variovorax sp. LT1R16 TaxID=3443728 RepID=UPI003F483780